ncbi:MAG: thioredoxin domain-containing protein [bacterium]
MRTPPPRKNHLAFETSPYLLQHASNPVDWYPWGEEAFAKARAEQKPILVSIGYSSCHWCHVMEHESFEDSTTAKLMNELFVCIKVDREERPDVDEVYMTAVQLLGVGGGWPLNVFLTPDGKPFFGGTYFPPDRRYGRGSWREVLTQVAAAWRDQREKVVQQSGAVLDALKEESAGIAGGDARPEERLLARAADSLAAHFDSTWGGFGSAPKFPPSLALELLLRRWADSHDAHTLQIVERTLDGMAEGGMYDQLGGGFHRYSVDEKWLVPHFEKMLYDNAQLARVYVEAFQLTGEERYQRIARETLDWVLREMTEPEGGFRSATDADSEGREGLYFVWTKPEIEERLGADAALFLAAYGVTADGNFDDPHHPRRSGEPGMNVLHVARPVAEVAATHGLDAGAAEASLARSRKILLEARTHRVYPGLDDKVLTSWNALMIGTMAYAGRALNEPRYVEAARRAADFVLTKMRTKEGRLLRTSRKGESKIPAFLEDHAFLANALLDLYETTFELRWFREATSTARAMDALFRDEARGGWFHTAADGESLVARPVSPFDGSIPSANGAATIACARLEAFTGDAFWRDRADSALRRFAPSMERAPAGTITLLLALDDVLHAGGEVAVVGRAGDPKAAALEEPVRRAFLPRTVVARLDPGDNAAEAERTIPLLAGKRLVNGSPAVYVCRDFACRAPVTTAAEVAEAIRGL